MEAFEKDETVEFLIPPKATRFVLAEAEYRELVEAHKILGALYAVGVTNWDGYELALEMVDDEEE